MAKTGRDRRLRLWPGVVAVGAQWLVWFILPLTGAISGGVAILGGVAGGALVLLWWLFLSRAPWLERLAAIAVIGLTVAALRFVVHPSIENGFMGRMLFLFAIPPACLGLVAAAAAARGRRSGIRLASIAAGVVLACSTLALVRTDGITGDADSLFRLRWTPTAEERLLAREREEPAAPAASPDPAPSAPAATVSAAPSIDRPAPSAPEAVPGRAPADPPLRRAAAWPGFRGAARDGVVRGITLSTDWSSRPPVAMWRRPIGPGWSSFAVAGDLIYTQEQRGEDESVSAYRLATGELAWRHTDRVRFWESNGGAGPRATPAVQDGRIYTVGGTGIVNALDAATGRRFWSRDAVADTSKEIPGWGITSSPLVVGDLVIVAVAGRLVAYDSRTGDLRWLGEDGGGGYSSPHLATIAGVPQVLLLRGARTVSVSPSDGARLWDHSWQPAVSIVQPGLTAEGDVLVASGDAMGGLGIRRLGVTRTADGWTVQERWTTRGLKPYFNDFLVHEGHAYGFDGSILSCIELAGGERKWKGGRYGHGQMVLLPDQDLLLILSEEGELALVRAAPDGYSEVARVPGIEGKTWNHPVVAGDVLLVRNGEQMAAFRLPLEAR